MSGCVCTPRYVRFLFLKNGVKSNAALIFIFFIFFQEEII